MARHKKLKFLKVELNIWENENGKVEDMKTLKIDNVHEITIFGYATIQVNPYDNAKIIIVVYADKETVEIKNYIDDNDEHGIYLIISTPEYNAFPEGIR